MADIRKEMKRINKMRIAKFISQRGQTSKAEIAAELQLSMPTALQNVKELVEEGLVVESGEYESTGGRKAKALTIADGIGFVAGMDITANHIAFALVNMRRELVKTARIRLSFEDSCDYYEKMGEALDAFIAETAIDRAKIVGVGISLPGIVNKEEKMLLRSHALNVRNISFRNFQNLLKYPFELENDANSAAYAEFMQKERNTIYLSLSNTVGGAIYLHDRLFPGENFKSGEFGHMIIEKDGRACYCGKKGCADAYLSSKLLQSMANDSLEAFFQKVREQDEICRKVWEEYLEYLAIVVTNLRMAFDCDIVLGGYVGGYLEEFLPMLHRRILEYNNFDPAVTYLRTGKYKYEAAAYGVTLPFVDRFFEKLKG